MLATNRAAISYGRSSLAGETTIKEISDLSRNSGKKLKSIFGSDGSISPDDISTSYSCDMRYLGQEHPVNLPVDLKTATVPSILSDFHETHERTYTFRLDDTPVEFVTYRLKARARVPRPEITKLGDEGRSIVAALKGKRTVNFGDYGKHEATIYERSLLPPTLIGSGPIIVEEATSTTMVLPGQTLRVDEHGFLRITRQTSHS